MAKSTKPKSKPDTQNGDTPEVKVAKVAMWQAILVALITTIGGLLIGYYSNSKKSDETKKEEKPVIVVPIQNTNVVKSLPEENNADLYELKKDVSIFDLRQWRATPDSLKETRFSPCNYTNYLHIKKTKPLNKIVIHYGTSGYAIDMRCITNKYEFYQKEKPDFHDGKTVKEYALVVDVSGIPLNQEFLIVIEATYWNGFNNLTEEDASTYTDEEIHGLDELGLIVFLPEGKAFKEVFRSDRSNVDNKEDSYRGLENYYEDKNKKFIYWSIKERLPNHHYKLRWTW